MVREMKKNQPTIFICEECGAAYQEKRWAAKCEVWCKQYNSCNLEILKHAVPLE